MSFTPKVFYQTEFQGNRVTMNLGRLKRRDLMKLTPHISAEGKMDFKSTMGFLEVMGGILPSYVTDFDLEIESTKISFEQVIEEVFFMELMTSISMQLFSLAGISEIDSKNSGVPLVESTMASSGTNPSK